MPHVDGNSYALGSGEVVPSIQLYYIHLADQLQYLILVNSTLKPLT